MLYVRSHTCSKQQQRQQQAERWWRGQVIDRRLRYKQLTTVQRGSATRAWCRLLLLLLLLLQGGGVAMASQLGVSNICAAAVVAVCCPTHTGTLTAVLCCMIRSHTASTSGAPEVVMVGSGDGSQTPIKQLAIA